MVRRLCQFQQLAEQLSGDVLEQHLHVESPARANLGHWDRQTLPRAVRPSDRVFVEVYE